MALVKYCDNPTCKNQLGGDKTFVQIHGSVCDQFEPGVGPVEFRYLNDRRVYTFCDDNCDIEWRNYQRQNRGFKKQESEE